MNKFGVLLRVEAKAGKEAEVEKLLTSALTEVEKEPGTMTWHLLRFSPSSFGIFDSFRDRDAREQHLAGPIPALLSARAGELLARPPLVEEADILAEKISLAEAQVAGPPTEAAA